MNPRYLIAFAALSLILIGFQNCSSQVQFGVADLNRVVKVEDAVCDPFQNSENSEADAQHGLVGELRYLVQGVHGDTRSELNSRHLEYYLNEGIPAEGVLFFSEVNTPTMSFTAGFTNGAGELLQNPVTMEDLVEYFSMSFDTRLQLGLSDAPGEYQLALLSDDGSALYLGDQEIGFDHMIDNDGTHSARLKCMDRTVSMDLETAVPFQVQYFQGPRTEIAFQLLWRQVEEGDDLSDPLCGKSGGSTFFTGYKYGGDSVPTQAYLDFMDRGWKVLEPANYLLPTSVESNPCVDAGDSGQ